MNKLGIFANIFKIFTLSSSFFLASCIMSLNMAQFDTGNTPYQTSSTVAEEALSNDGMASYANNTQYIPPAESVMNSGDGPSNDNSSESPQGRLVRFIIDKKFLETLTAAQEHVADQKVHRKQALIHEKVKKKQQITHDAHEKAQMKKKAVTRKLIIDDFVINKLLAERKDMRAYKKELFIDASIIKYLEDHKKDKRKQILQLMFADNILNCIEQKAKQNKREDKIESIVLDKKIYDYLKREKQTQQFKTLIIGDKLFHFVKTEQINKKPELKPQKVIYFHSNDFNQFGLQPQIDTSDQKKKRVFEKHLLLKNQAITNKKPEWQEDQGKEDRFIR